MNQQQVVCSRCVVQGVLPNRQVVNMNRPMEFTGQFPVRGVHTYAYHCVGCNGKAHLQQHVDPRTGRPVVVQVRLSGTDDEFRPNAVGPNEQLKIDVAYSLSQGRGGHHVPTAPIEAPTPGIQLDPRIDQSTMITQQHPMHPVNIQQRMNAVRLSDLAG